MAYVITLNAGSSSVKFALFVVDGAAPETVALALAETVGEQRRLRVHDG